MKTLLTIFFTTYLSFLFGQNWLPPQSIGMGDIGAVSVGTPALFTNQAGLAKVDDMALMGGVERRYFWADVNLLGMGLVLPTQSGTFGLQVQRFGITDFKRQKYGLAYGRKVLDAIRLGGQFNYFRTEIPEYGSAHNFSFELGIQADLTKDLMIGTHIANPFQSNLSDNEKWPTVFQMGLFYKVSEKAAVTMELEKDIDFSMRLKMGVVYRPVEKFEFRTGYSGEPSQFHFGFGYLTGKRFGFHFGGRYDFVLGVSFGCGVEYIFNKKGEQ